MKTKPLFFAVLLALVMPLAAPASGPHDDVCVVRSEACLDDCYAFGNPTYPGGSNTCVDVCLARYHGGLNGQVCTTAINGVVWCVDLQAG